MDCVIKKNYEPALPLEKTLTVNYTGVENNRCRFSIEGGRTDKPGVPGMFIYLDPVEVLTLMECLNKYVAAYV